MIVKDWKVSGISWLLCALLACSAQDGRGQYRVHLSDQASSSERPGAGQSSCTVWRAQSGARGLLLLQTPLLLDFPSCQPPLKPVLLGTHGQQNAAARPLFALSPSCPCPLPPAPALAEMPPASAQMQLALPSNHHIALPPHFLQR